MEMDEIDLGALLLHFVERLYIIFIVVVICLIGGLGYTVFLKEPLYKSDVNLIIVNKDNNATAIQSEIIANQKLASTYRELIGSRRILKQVINNLGLDYNYDELNDLISVENVNGTEILKITVASKNSKEAKEIANEIALIFQEEIINIYNLENVSIIDKAEIEKEPYNINIVKDSIIYIGLGLVLSCGIIFMIYYFDNTIKSVEQVEKYLGVPVIGAIPVVGKKGN